MFNKYRNLLLITFILSLVSCLSGLFTSAYAEEEGGFAAYLKEREQAEQEAEKKEEKIQKEEKNTTSKKKKNKKAKADTAHKNDAAEDSKERKTKEAEKPATGSNLSKEEAQPAPTKANETEPLNIEKNENTTSLILKTPNQCLVLEFTTLANGELSCKETLPTRYTKRACKSGEVLEVGETEAQVSCPDKKQIEINFRTSQDAIHASLRVKRQSEGRAGTTTSYRVREAYEDASLLKKLSEPQIKSGESAEESPLKLKFSGFATLEWEQSHNFGYDVGTAQPNFDHRVKQPKQRNFNFFTNFGFEAARDQTSLISLFEIGEIYYGNTASGGAQGARATNIFEVRNLYLNHSFSDALSMKGGVITTASDPRSFIFNDHIASVQGNYKTDLSEGLLWYGNSSQNRPAAEHARDEYIGFMGTLGFLTGVKTTLYGIHREKDSDQLTLNDGASTLVTGDSSYNWLGTTLEFEPFNSFTIQGTGIRNWVKTRFNSSAGSPTDDSYSSHLLDAKMTKAWGGTSFIVSIEGLATSGAKGATDSTTGKQIQGKRGNFVSPVSAAYLLTIATSDGVDDAPGTPKESIIANLNQDEGLRALIGSVNANFTRKTSGFIRYGYLQTAKTNSANHKHLGDEIDLGLVHQMTPSTSLQFDYGFFQPGNFFLNGASARLAALKMKFIF